MFITGLKILASYVVACVIVTAIGVAIYFVVLYPWIIAVVVGFVGVSLFAMVVYDWLWGKKQTEAGNG